MVTGIKRIVLDILKPSKGPSLVELAKTISKLDGISAVNISLIEIDRETENVKITVEGDSIDYNSLVSELEKYNAVVHSVDEVAAGKKVIEAVKTYQD